MAHNDRDLIFYYGQINIGIRMKMGEKKKQIKTTMRSQNVSIGTAIATELLSATADAAAACFHYFMLESVNG